jgi:hypothetical protein
MRASSLLLFVFGSLCQGDAGQASDVAAMLQTKLGSHVAGQASAKAGATGKMTSNRSASDGHALDNVYTQNSFCRATNCINPIFPGLSDLPKLEALQWQCTVNSQVKQYMDFCKDSVPYDPALPSPVSKSTPVDELIKAQEDAAMTMFFFHLNGLGYDAWDHRNPSESDSSCVRSIWKMVCYTYFPRAEAGCKSGETSTYKRPCSSSCHNYVSHCGVECCDESVACVFSNPVYDSNGQLQLTETGYIDHSGPSATCTGSAKHTTSFPLFPLLCILGFHWASATTKATDERREAVGKRRRGLPKCLMMCLAVLMALLLQ